jgi:hypothetical protein
VFFIEVHDLEVGIEARRLFDVLIQMLHKALLDFIVHHPLGAIIAS